MSPIKNNNNDTLIKTVPVHGKEAVITETLERIKSVLNNQVLQYKEDKQDFISIVIPIYNEESVITETLEQIKKVLSKQNIAYEIIAVNDGSSDSTIEVLKEHSDDISVIDRDRNRGYGFSLKEGIKKATGEWILIIDADGSYPIEEIPSLISETATYDMVVGERSKNKVGMGVLNRVGKLLIKVLIYALTSRWIKDINSGFRIFRKDLALKYWGLIPDGFSFTTTLTVAAMIEQYKVRFIPIDYFTRVGKSKIRPIRDFLSFIILVLKIISFFKPLRFYLPISVFFLLCSSLRAIRDIIVANGIGSAAILLFMISIQAFFFGLLADLFVNKHNGFSSKSLL